MVSEGDRIELVATSDEYTKLEPGDKGTVTDVTTTPASVSPQGKPERKIHVDWDTGSSLALIASQDSFNVIEKADDA